MTTTQTKPIDLYFWPTPNGQKISIALEELAVPYNTHFVNIGKGDQFKPEFLKISPNNRIPAIVDPEGPDGQSVSVFESGAILIYLAEKFGQLYGSSARDRIAINEWLMWQMGGVGPMFGQLNHFRNYAPEKVPYAITRYLNETNRLYRVLNTQLDGREYVAGSYSIADIALFGWIRNWESRGVDIAEYPHVKSWHDRVWERPAVQRGIELKAPESFDLSQDADAQKVLFNQR